MKECPSRVLERRGAFYGSTWTSIIHVFLLGLYDIRPFARVSNTHHLTLMSNANAGELGVMTLTFGGFRDRSQENNTSGVLLWSFKV